MCTTLTKMTVTGVSRCYPFWQEYMACYVINHDNAQARKQGICVPKLEDYYECLHHRKEVDQRLRNELLLRVCLIQPSKREHKLSKTPTERWKLHILGKMRPRLDKYEV